MAGRRWGTVARAAARAQAERARAERAQAERAPTVVTSLEVASRSGFFVAARVRAAASSSFVVGLTRVLSDYHLAFATCRTDNYCSLVTYN